MNPGAQPFSEFDRTAYNDLEALLRDETIRESWRPTPPKRTFSAEDRQRLLDELPSLVPIGKCSCGDAVCMSYDFREHDKTVTPFRLIELDVAGIAILQLDESGRLLSVERITDTRGLSSAPFLREASRCKRVVHIRRGPHRPVQASVQAAMMKRYRRKKLPR